jgi:hypothetical protein
MNTAQPKPRVVREVPAELEEIMRLASQIQNGVIVIKIHQKKLSLVEYTVKKQAEDQVEVLPLI